MSSDLKPVVERAEAAIRAYVRARVDGGGAFTLGAFDIDPKYFSVWITTATDRQRDQLARDKAVPQEVRRLMAEAGYPAEAIPKVGLTFESEETVQRKYGGNWWHAVK